MFHRAALGAVVLVLVSASVAAADKTVAVDIVASSTAKGKADKFAAWRAVDGSTGTAWCEGKADEGVDEMLTLRLSEPLKVTRIDLYVGLHGSQKEYKENNRVSKLAAQTAPKIGDPLVSLSKGAPIVSEYDTLVKLDLKTPRVVQVLELGLAGVTRGDKLKKNDTCISEVSLMGENGEVINFLYGLPPDALASMPAGVKAARDAMTSCDEAAIAKAVKFPYVHYVEAEEDSHDMKLKNAKAFAKACKKGDLPKIPASADAPDQMSPGGPGQVRLEVDDNYLVSIDMAWVKGAWMLAHSEGH
jgi:hypothetical protein